MYKDSDIFEALAELSIALDRQGFDPEYQITLSKEDAHKFYMLYTPVSRFFGHENEVVLMNPIGKVKVKFL